MTEETSQRYNILSAFLAFILWGGWAFYVNDTSGYKIRIISGLVQGTASFIITIIMIRIMTAIFKFFPDNLLRILIPPALTICITGTGLISVHILFGTPRIMATVAPALTVGLVFCLYTAFKLYKKNHTSLIK